MVASPLDATAQTTRVNVTSGGEEARDGWSYDAAPSSDGRYVAFVSQASNLVAGDTNGAADVFVHDRVTAITTRVSLGVGGSQANGDSMQPAISGDGRFVTFMSRATNLVPGDTNLRADVFVLDRSTGQMKRVSVAAGGVQADGSSQSPSISLDGRHVAFVSDATNLVPGDTNGRVDVFVHDRLTAVTTRVSVALGGGQADRDSQEPVISGDGRFVGFLSEATNLVSGDTNGYSDAFVHERSTGALTRVSVSTGGVQAAGPSYSLSMSADGRYASFGSTASNLVVNDTNLAADVFVHDRTAGTTERVSVTTAAGQANGASDLPAMSADGRYVAFASTATNLVPADTNNEPDVFLYDRQTSTTRRVNVASGGTQAVGGIDNNKNVVGSRFPTISGDGRLVVFESWSVNLVTGDRNARPDVFVHDARMYQRQRVSVSSSGAQSVGGPNGGSDTLAVSGDARFVAFDSLATNLVPGDTNNAFDIFVRDRATGVTSRVSVATGGAQAVGASFAPSMSRDGRYVTFTSLAANLVPGDTNSERDVFVHDRQLGTTTRVSVGANGAQALGDSRDGSISEDGRLVAFSSDAANLVGDDTNGHRDVFVRDLARGTTVCVSVPTGGLQASGGASGTPAISGDGRFVAFVSAATNLVTGDDNAYDDIFVHELSSGGTTRVNIRTGGVQANPGSSSAPAISRDGRFVAFASEASNLVIGDTNNFSDIFVHDRLVGETTRVSVSIGGLQAGGASRRPVISADGRYIAFDTEAPNLVPDDTNGGLDVLVRDRVTGEVVRASLGGGEVQANSTSYAARLNGDGRVMAYLSAASNLVSDDTNGAVDVFVRASRPVLRTLTPRSGPTTGGTTLRIAGEGFVSGTTVTVGGLLATNVDASDTTLLWATTPSHGAGAAEVVVAVPGHDAERVPLGFTFVAPSGAPSADSDGDGVPDAFESQFSLDLLDPSDAARDLDGDGLSVADEFQSGSHPNGRVTRYLAEGATSAFFRSQLALVNPGDGDATVLLRFLRATGAPLVHVLRVPAHSRKTIEANELPGLQTAEFSTVLESDRLVALDRTMTWDAQGYGSHTGAAIPALSMTWYLAEGATHSGFDLFYLLQNPAATPTTVQVTYLLPPPAAPLVKTYTVAPRSRFSIWVDAESALLANTDVSAHILASQPIAVERAMYLSRPGQLFVAGHQSAAVTAAETEWFLAEGATGPYFDLFVLIANPNATAADVVVTFLKAGGGTVVKSYSIAPRSRFNIWVDAADPELANAAVSTAVLVTNGVPIVVERAMWWPGAADTWHEAHNSAGATSTGTLWAVASGEVGGSADAETYVLVANTASYDAHVRVALLFEDGTTATRFVEVPSESRFNVAVRSVFPEAEGRRFGAVVESIGLGAAPLVVECAMYRDANGVQWAAGSNALATKLR